MIRSVYSYKGKGGSLKETVGAIVQAGSKKIIVAYKNIVEKKLERTAKVWQAWLRQRLSVKGSPHKINRTPWPKMRTGKLRDSIRRPMVVEPSAYSGPASYAPSYKFEMVGLFDVRPSATLADVGEHLNTWKGKPFEGWKIRAQRNLYDRMIADIKSVKLGK